MITNVTSNSEVPLGALVFLRRVASALIAVASLRLTMWVFGVPVSAPYQALFIITALLTLLVMGGTPSTFGTRLSQSFWNKLVTVGSSWTLIIAALLALGYLTKSSAFFSRKALVSWIVLTPFLILLVRYWIDACILRVRLSANRNRTAVVAGAGSLGEKLVDRISSDPRLGIKMLGFFEDRSTDRLNEGVHSQLLGGLSDISQYVKQHKIDLIFFALPIRNVLRVSEVLDELHDSTASIYYVPDVFVFDLIQCRTDQIDDMPVVALCETPFYGTRGLAKRISDIVLSTGILLAISPLLVCIAAAIKLDSRGPIIFRQHRYGLDGAEIEVYKFRSMRVTENSGPIRQASRDDPRVTRVGKFLRQYSLDELPQFINVLQGRMSIVGPRPHAVAHNEEYRRLIKGYMIRHKVKPGITGLAQIRGLRGETKDLDSMRARIESDLEYLRSWSLVLDFKIILRTIAVVAADDAAY